MAISRIGGKALRANLERDSNLTFNTDTLAIDYSNGRIGIGTTTAFTMSTSVASDQTQRIIVAVGNVFQNPASAYTLSGTTITFTSPPGNAETITVIHGLDSTTT